MEQMLYVGFYDRMEFERAKVFFDEESSYFADEVNDEFMRLGFAENCNFDELEDAISDDLEEAGITGFSFGRNNRV